LPVPGHFLSGILLVERSTTLNHLLRRTLAATALPVRAEIGNYLEALGHLRRLSERSSDQPPYAVAIVGAPARPTREFMALLEYLRDAADAPPTVLVAHEETAEIRAWCTDSPRTRFLLWSQFGRIPASVHELAPDEVAPPPQGIDADERVRILFVDDSQSVRLAYTQALERSGYAVDAASSIAEAEAIAAEIHHDLVIVDYFLPDGTGDELCRRLAARAHPPVLAVITGSYREDIIKRCLHAGASECMFKNEARELFLARVATLARTIEMRKSAEADRQHLDGILGSVGDGVFGIDAEGRISFVNPTGLRLLGHSDEHDLVGLLANAAIYPNESARNSRLARAYAEGDAVRHFETMFRRRDGSGMPVECTVLPLAAQRRRHGAVVVFRDIAERRTAERLRWELNNDPLTGLPNARHLRQRLIQEITRLRERGGYSALLHIAIGEDADSTSPRGDERLRTVAQTLARRLREGDVLARGDGDIFLLLLSGVQVDNIDVLARSFQNLLDGRTYLVGEAQHSITARVGAELLNPRTVSADDALECARAAVAREPTQAPEPLVRDVMVSPSSERLRIALEQARFVILAQPIVALSTRPGAGAGWAADGSVEPRLFAVRMRMVGKDGQLILPRAFVPLAERVGMIQRIDLWVIHGLLAHLASERGRETPVGLVARLAPATVADPESLEAIEKAIVETGVPASQLVLEIIDSGELANLPAARRFIARLQAIGCRFVLRGSGNGQGSLPFLSSQRLPGDFVRLERSLVQRVATDARELKRAASIANLAQSLDMRVIAGAVDSAATLAALAEAGIDFVQGDHLGEARLLKRIDFAALAAAP
jgi:PAS domain S-box-containing protein/diguanylate cyclase (GGDEF)-like protein